MKFFSKSGSSTFLCKASAPQILRFQILSHVGVLRPKSLGVLSESTQRIPIRLEVLAKAFEKPFSEPETLKDSHLTFFGTQEQNFFLAYLNVGLEQMKKVHMHKVSKGRSSKVCLNIPPLYMSTLPLTGKAPYSRTCPPYRSKASDKWTPLP